MIHSKSKKAFQRPPQSTTTRADSALARLTARKPSKAVEGRKSAFMRLSQALRARSAIWKPARLIDIPTPTPFEWVRFFAEVGTDFEFLIELFYYLKEGRHGGGARPSSSPFAPLSSLV